MSGLQAQLGGFIAAVKPWVSAFFSDIGAVIFNRPAPARGVAVSLVVLAVLIALVPKAIKKLSK